MKKTRTGPPGDPVSKKKLEENQSVAMKRLLIDPTARRRLLTKRGKARKPGDDAFDG